MTFRKNFGFLWMIIILISIVDFAIAAGEKSKYCSFIHITQFEDDSSDSDSGPDEDNSCYCMRLSTEPCGACHLYADKLNTDFYELIKKQSKEINSLAEEFIESKDCLNVFKQEVKRLTDIDDESRNRFKYKKIYKYESFVNEILVSLHLFEYAMNQLNFFKKYMYSFEEKEISLCKKLILDLDKSLQKLAKAKSNNIQKNNEILQNFSEYKEFENFRKELGIDSLKNYFEDQINIIKNIQCYFVDKHNFEDSDNCQEIIRNLNLILDLHKSIQSQPEEASMSRKKRKQLLLEKLKKRHQQQT